MVMNANSIQDAWMECQEFIASAGIHEKGGQPYA